MSNSTSAIRRTLLADDEPDIADQLTLNLEMSGFDVVSWPAGADYYVTKPYEFDELLRYIAYLEDNAAPSPDIASGQREDGADSTVPRTSVR